MWRCGSNTPWESDIQCIDEGLLRVLAVSANACRSMDKSYQQPQKVHSSQLQHRTTAPSKSVRGTPEKSSIVRTSQQARHSEIDCIGRRRHTFHFLRFGLNSRISWLLYVLFVIGHKWDTCNPLQSFTQAFFEDASGNVLNGGVKKIPWHFANLDVECPELSVLGAAAMRLSSHPKLKANSWRPKGLSSLQVHFKCASNILAHMWYDMIWYDMIWYSLSWWAEVRNIWIGRP